MIETNDESEAKRVRYAVVGLGPVAQAGVLPAFANAAENCELAAFVSDDPLKHKKLGKRYRVSLAYSYDDYDACLRSGEVDAVYVTVAPRLRRDFVVRAIEAGLHVVSERPLALTEEECEAVLRAAQRKNAKLLVAYRLYQQEGNTKAIEFCRAGKIGEPRSITAVLSTQVKSGDARLESPGGGPLNNLGVDAVHLARKLFGAEPLEAFAFAQKSPDPRFAQGEEGVTAVLRFPGDRLASMSLSFNSADASYFHVLGTKGDLRCDPAFDAESESRHTVTLQGKRKERTFDPRDGFAPLLLGFSDAVLRGSAPSPGAADALADIRALRALERSLREGRPARVGPERPPAGPPRPPAPASEARKAVVRRAFAEPLSALTNGEGTPAPGKPVA